jgi:putative membrane protein
MKRRGDDGTRWWLVTLLLFACNNLDAHTTAASQSSGGPANWHELAESWAFEPWVIIPLALSLWLYLSGLQNLSRATHRGILKWETASYFAGWLALVIALVSPLHPWGQVLFSAHMTQHEILMLVAAPLMVLGRPMLVFAKALPSGCARGIAAFSNHSCWSRLWRAITQPFTAWLIHALALWLWHIPSWFERTLRSEFIHALQHVSFLGTALLFWWAVMHGRKRLAGYGLAVLYMFTTALHSGLLGALLTFTRTLWYPAYATTAPAWGLTGIEDQQLGGLIMWIPAGAVYIIAGLAFFAGWLRESDRRAARHSDKMLATPS